MNMKLLTALAVAVTLASAMAFVGLSGKPAAPSVEPKTGSAGATVPAAQSIIDDSASSGASQVETRLNTTSSEVTTTLKVK